MIQLCTSAVSVWPYSNAYFAPAGTGNKSARSLLSGSLVRLATTTELVQVAFGTTDARGHRVLQLKVPDAGGRSSSTEEAINMLVCMHSSLEFYAKLFCRRLSSALNC